FRSLAVPVVTGGGAVLGGLFFGHPEPGRFGSEHETLLLGIAGQAATAIDNARLFQSAQRELDERRRVQALSGGQQQRVALARAIAPEPPILLLDEPLSNLDAALRERTRTELRQLLKRLRMTAVFVTHDQAEAFDLSDRIAIMQDGRIQQLGTPEQLYLAPVNPFVASFVGKANFLPGRLLHAGPEALCEVAEGVRWPVQATAGAGAGPVRVLLRPESLRLVPGGSGAAATIPGRIVERRFGGPATMYLVEAAGTTLLIAEAGVPRGLPPEVAVGLADGVVPPAFGGAST
ncbi:MAG: ATP-binding cassette domain-containing protein, partial [Gemmatimonadetes bacterium]|nr:ATP-binding cassette domain-containing protein [Gemmatimonadota bacterium]